MVTDMRNGIRIPNKLDQYLARRAMDWEEYEWWLIHLLNIGVIQAPMTFLGLWSQPRQDATLYRIYTEKSIMEGQHNDLSHLDRPQFDH